MKMWEIDHQKVTEEEGNASKFSTTQTSRTGSSWSTQNNQDLSDKGREKPTSNQSYKPGDKEFKYFVPQGVKANTTLGTGKSTYTGLPTNPNQGQFQNFNHSSQFSNPNNSATTGNMNLNNSSSSAYRANQVPPGSFIPQKNLPIPSSKGMTGLSSPNSMHQTRTNVPVYTAQNTGFQQMGQQGQWRKH